MTPTCCDKLVFCNPDYPTTAFSKDSSDTQITISRYSSSISLLISPSFVQCRYVTPVLTGEAYDDIKWRHCSTYPWKFSVDGCLAIWVLVTSFARLSKYVLEQFPFEAQEWDGDMYRGWDGS